MRGVYVKRYFLVSLFLLAMSSGLFLFISKPLRCSLATTSIVAAMAGCAELPAALADADTSSGRSARVDEPASRMRLAIIDSVLEVGATTTVTIVDAEFAAASRRRFFSPTVVWRSSDSTVARVTPSGAVAALDEGSAQIEAVWNDRVGRTDVRVLKALPPPATGPDTTGSSDPPRPAPEPEFPLPADSPAELPRVYVQLPTAEGTGTVRRVAAGQNLQAAIDAAAMGDVIVLQAGATFVGPIRLRKKNGDGWITIRTDAAPTTRNNRVSLEDTLRFARIVSGGLNQPAVTTEAGASGYWLVNLDIARVTTPPTLTTLVSLGDGGSAQNSLEKIPSRIVLDRVIVRGRENLTLRRCISLQSANSAVVNSVVIGCQEKGADSQAIAGWNGPGPFLISNNLLEGAGENILFGGADPTIPGTNPSDIVIEWNHIRKPEAWQASGQWTVKNSLELKQGVRVLIRNNLIENNWPDGQSGVAVVLKSVNQSGGAPWAETGDITFVDNIVRRVSAAITLAARPESHPAVPMSRLLFARNVLYDIGADSPFPAGTERALLVLGGVANLHFVENTIVAPASVINIVRDGNPPIVHNLSFVRNLANFGRYGIHGSGFGIDSFTASYTGVSFAENCLFGAVLSMQSKYLMGATLTQAPRSTVLPELALGIGSVASGSACSGSLLGGGTPGAPADLVQRVAAAVLAGVVP